MPIVNVSKWCRSKPIAEYLDPFQNTSYMSLQLHLDRYISFKFLLSFLPIWVEACPVNTIHNQREKCMEITEQCLSEFRCLKSRALATNAFVPYIIPSLIRGLSPVWSQQDIFEIIFKDEYIEAFWIELETDNCCCRRELVNDRIFKNFALMFQCLLFWLQGDTCKEVNWHFQFLKLSFKHFMAQYENNNTISKKNSKILC